MNQATQTAVDTAGEPPAAGRKLEALEIRCAEASAARTIEQSKRLAASSGSRYVLNLPEHNTTRAVFKLLRIARHSVMSR